MRQHAFKVGQVVQVLPHLVPRGFRAAGKGQDADRLEADRFEIVRLMPESGFVLQYRIKSRINGQERLVTETDIVLPEV